MSLPLVNEHRPGVADQTAQTAPKRGRCSGTIRTHAAIRVALRWLCAGILGVVGWPAVTSAAPASAAPFGPAAFDEIVAQIRDRHILPQLNTPRPWVAAANGALSTLPAAEELLPASWLQAERGHAPGFEGATAPLRCGGPPRTDVLLHPKPARRWTTPWRLEFAPLRLGGLRNRDVDVEALGQWDVPFDEPAFRCVMSTVLERLPAQRHAQAWRNATTWLLRAHDAHSRLMSERTYQDLQDADAHHAELGLRLHRVDRIWRVAKLEVDGPADRAKILVDDALLAIGKLDATAMSRADLAAALDKPVGTSVTLRMQTAEQAPRDVALTVQDVTVPDVIATPLPPRWAGKALRHGVRVQIGKFAPGGAERLLAALKPKGKPTPNALLLDLRGNPGGVIEVAMQVLGVLVGERQAAEATTRDGSATLSSDTSAGVAAGLPMVVLIDSGCASACELVAAGLRRHGQALILGARSYGKATAQDATALKHASGRVALTIGYFGPGEGVQIQGLGVEPDVPLGSVRSQGPREEDQAFALRWPSKPAPMMARERVASLERCRDAASGQPGGDDGVIATASDWLRCHASVSVVPPRKN